MATRSRRLRKKLYVDEFQVMGFEIAFDYALHNDESAVDAFLDSMIEFVESCGLFVGGGIHERGSFFVVREGRYESTTAEDISAFTNWLKDQARVTNIESSGLVDANYP